MHGLVVGSLGSAANQAKPQSGHAGPARRGSPAVTPGFVPQRTGQYAAAAPNVCATPRTAPATAGTATTRSRMHGSQDAWDRRGPEVVTVWSTTVGGPERARRRAQPELLFREPLLTMALPVPRRGHDARGLDPFGAGSGRPAAPVLFAAGVDFRRSVGASFGGWTPAVDIEETDGFVVGAELPAGQARGRQLRVERELAGPPR